MVAQWLALSPQQEDNRFKSTSQLGLSTVKFVYSHRVQVLNFLLQHKAMAGQVNWWLLRLFHNRGLALLAPDQRQIMHREK